MNSPGLVLADEPTGNLDSVTGAGILDIFKGIRAAGNSTIVMVTHDRNVASLAELETAATLFHHLMESLAK